MPSEFAERPARLPARIAPLVEQRPQLPPLPAPLTRLIGRAGEIERVRGLVRDPAIRLVTLSGPGGVGKTRLALQIADAERRAGAAVGFLPLATVDSPDLVVAAIAGIVRARLTSDRPPIERVASAIGSWPLLLTLDNLEQVPGITPLLATLLRACPRLTILATSRARLRVSGEHVVVVEPLSSPDPDRMPPLDQVAAHDAIGLFVERAQAANDRFVLTAENAADVARLCRRLDGLPLAIELAASRSNALTPPALLARTVRRLAFLSGGSRDNPSRLQTMRAAIEWSYELLTPEEQLVFRRLAAFAGGFTLDATSHLQPFPASQQPAQPHAHSARDSEVIDIVQSLVDKSLIRAIDGHREPRFELLETIREYGMERLTAADEEHTTRETHADYFIGLAERAEPDFGGSHQDAWFVRFEDEVANVRTALDWLMAQRDAERGLRLCTALGWFWSSRGHHREGRARLESFLALPTASGAEALWTKGLLMAGNHAQWLGDYPAATNLFERALDACLSRGDRHGAALARRGLASVAIDLESPDRADALIQASLTTLRTLGTAWDHAFAALLLGRVAHLRGDLAEACDNFESAARRFGVVGDRDYQMAALGDLANSALLGSEIERSQQAHELSLTLAADRDDEWVTARFLVSCAGSAARAGDPTSAARYLAAAEVWRDEFSSPYDPLTRAAFNHVANTVHAALGEDVIRATGRALGRRALDQAIADIRLPKHERAPSQVVVPPDGSTAGGPGFAITPREMDVLRLLVEGLTDKEIADRLGVSRRTVSKHVQMILAKLDAPTRTAAATYAARFGLV